MNIFWFDLFFTPDFWYKVVAQLELDVFRGGEEGRGVHGGGGLRRKRLGWVGLGG